MSPLLDGLRIIEIGGRAAAVCTRMFAESGTNVLTVQLRGKADPGLSGTGESLVRSAS